MAYDTFNKESFNKEICLRHRKLRKYRKFPILVASVWLDIYLNIIYIY